MFENEFLYADSTTVSLEQMYENRIKKLTDDLNDWKNQLETRKKQLADKKKILNTVISSSSNRANTFSYAYQANNKNQVEVKKGIEAEIRSLNGIIYQIENVEIPNKEKELESVKKEYFSLYSKQSSQITQAAMQSAGLSKEEFDQILKTQIEIEQQKIQSNRLKIFMGVGVGLLTLLILFKTLK